MELAKIVLPKISLFSAVFAIKIGKYIALYFKRKYGLFLGQIEPYCAPSRKSHFCPSIFARFCRFAGVKIFSFVMCSFSSTYKQNAKKFANFYEKSLDI